MDTFQQIDQVWQELREGIFWSANEIRRVISRWDKNAQIDYFQQKTQVLSDEIVRIHKGYANMIRKDTNILTKKVFLLMSGLKKREILLKGLMMNLRLLKFDGGARSGLTPEMIAVARDYPIGELVEVNRSFALCPFHNDKRHPNLYIKNNWGYCFACGWSGDSIKFIMNRNKLNFVEAVKKLVSASI